MCTWKKFDDSICGSTTNKISVNELPLTNSWIYMYLKG